MNTNPILHYKSLRLFFSFSSVICESTFKRFCNIITLFARCFDMSAVCSVRSCFIWDFTLSPVSVPDSVAIVRECSTRFQRPIARVHYWPDFTLNIDIKKRTQSEFFAFPGSDKHVFIFNQRLKDFFCARDGTRCRFLPNRTAGNVGLDPPRWKSLGLCNNRLSKWRKYGVNSLTEVFHM